MLVLLYSNGSRLLVVLFRCCIVADDVFIGCAGWIISFIMRSGGGPPAPYANDADVVDVDVIDEFSSIVVAGTDDELLNS